ncbi:MAG: hypothetical protein H5U02_04955 [Clostridia bacterium]|nr:hypothetical protein [Clostridia bacterium]
MEPVIGLLTELLLRKTTAEQVSKAYLNLVTNLKTFSTLRQCPGELRVALRPLGLYKQRLIAVEQIVNFLNTRHSGRLPSGVDQLLEIPHVGPYIANATRCFYLNQPAPIVDVNVARLLGRFFGVSGNTSNPIRTRIYWLLAAALVPRQRAKEYNWGLLDLGALVCTPRQPKCPSCPLNIGCSYNKHFCNWRGLGNSELLEVQALYWKASEVPTRLTELAGLRRVPRVESTRKLLANYAINLAVTDTVYELDLRRFSLQHYCDTSLRDKVNWVCGY